MLSWPLLRIIARRSWKKGLQGGFARAKVHRIRGTVDAATRQDILLAHVRKYSETRRIQNSHLLGRSLLL